MPETKYITINCLSAECPSSRFELQFQTPDTLWMNCASTLTPQGWRKSKAGLAGASSGESERIVEGARIKSHPRTPISACRRLERIILPSYSLPTSLCIPCDKSGDSSQNIQRKAARKPGNNTLETASNGANQPQRVRAADQRNGETERQD